MKLEQLKTFEGACKVLGLNPKKVVPAFPGFPKKDQKAMVAHAKLVIIARAANRIGNGGKDWKPDWNNGKWDKYHNWFWMNKEGSSGFRFDGCDAWNSRSSVGSRLCFKSRKLAEYAGQNFTSVYKQFMVIE